MDRELIVADDPVEAALGIFLRTQPRLVALAGGRTPEPLYARLSTAFLGYPWADVDVVFTDERCVGPDDPDSNLGMAHRALLSKIQARVHPMNDCDPDAAERELGSLGLPGRGLDLAILGLGRDGHTASLFPGDPTLDEIERMVVRVERPDHPRLTLTIPVLSRASAALFLATGAAKREALGRLMGGDDIPAARIEAPRVVIVADAAAAP